MKSTFYVGCRVKIIDPRSLHLGKCATVTNIRLTEGINHLGGGQFKIGQWHYVNVDAIGNKNKNGGPLAYLQHQLEPIWPGSEKTTWAECMWKPVPLGKRKLETA